MSGSNWRENSEGLKRKVFSFHVPNDTTLPLPQAQCWLPDFPLWTRLWHGASFISLSTRIGAKGIWHPAISGHRQRPGVQAASGRPEGEPAGLPGPGGQRAAVQGWEEAVFQWQQTSGQLRVPPRWRTGLTVRKLCSAGTRRPQQAAVTSTSRQHWATEEGKTSPPLHLFLYSFSHLAGLRNVTNKKEDMLKYFLQNMKPNGKLDQLCKLMCLSLISNKKPCQCWCWWSLREPQTIDNWFWLIHLLIALFLNLFID